MVVRYPEILEVGSSWLDCPVAWQNLINNILHHHPSGIYDGVSNKQINDALQPFSAVYIEPENQNGFVEFYDSQQYMLFMLRWS